MKFESKHKKADHSDFEVETQVKTVKCGVQTWMKENENQLLIIKM